MKIQSFLRIVILVVVINLLITPVFPLVIVAAEQAQPFQEFERIDLRTATAKVFQTGPHSYRYEDSLNKIHFGTPGHYRPVDNRIVAIVDSKYKYRNSGNDFWLYAGEDLATGVRYESGKTVCEFKLDSIADLPLNNSTAQVKDNTITYPNVLPSVDLQFTVTSTLVKTDVVFNDTSKLQENIVFDVTNCNDKSFAQPVMNDGDSVAMIPRQSNVVEGRRHLVLNPEYKKLGKIKGQVRVDPSFYNPGSYEDVYVSPSTPDGNRHALLVGQYTNTIPCCATTFNSKSLMRFDLSAQASFPATAIVTSATLQIRQYDSESGSGTNVVVRQINQGWNESSQNTVATSGNYVLGGGTVHIPFYQIGFSGPDAIQRNIPLDPNFIQNLRSSNNGMSLEGNGLNDLGFVYCAGNVPPAYQGYFCGDGSRAPRLAINFVDNNPPFTPNLVSPVNNYTQTGNCDESVTPATGTCRTNMAVNFQMNNIGDGDPAPGNLNHTEIHFSGSNTNTITPIGGTGTINSSANLLDGVTNWFARSVDGMGATSDSVTFKFTLDNTPPSTPAATAMPTFTAGVGTDAAVQVTPQTTAAATDNVSAAANISYLLEYSPISDFSDAAQIYSKPWQPGVTSFQIGRLGANNVSDGGTGDDLADEGTYYFRIKAKDELNNITTWSNIISTTIDATHPDLSSFTSSENRISPSNVTSSGYKDSTVFSVVYTEKHPANAVIEIRDSSNNLVQTLTQDISANEGTTTPVTVNFPAWDGKDSSNNYLVDGAYTVTAKVTDKAGNVNDVIPSAIIIVDDSGANITISGPTYDYWTKNNNIDITGQLKAPAISGKQDQDLSQAEIQRTDLGAWQTITADPLGIFTSNQALQLGTNQFKFQTTDTVGNVQTQVWDPAISAYRSDWLVNSEATAPTISSVLPTGLSNNRRPTISFKATDPDPAGDRSQTSDIPIGTNPANMKVWLTYDILDNTQPLPYPTVNKSLDLIDNGINNASSLISNLTCSADAGAITSTKNGRSSADKVACSLTFNADLQPDATYQIHIQITDNATNSTSDTGTSFTIDSFNYSVVSNPIQGGLYSNSSVIFKGTAVKDTTLTIANTQSAQTRSFTLNSSLNGTGIDPVGPTQFLVTNFTVTCGNFVDVDGRTDTPSEEVCDWQVRVAQQYAPTNVDTVNNNIITDTDAAGNAVVNTRDITVNLYNFNLSVTSSLNYFSPNGDGNQDSVMFTQSATNSTDPSNQPDIDSWELRIRDSSSTIVRQFSGTGFLPNQTFFDGQILQGGNWVWLPDGNYTYELYVQTAAGAQVTTAPQALYSKTVLVNEVVITIPKDGFVTTQGMINVQGQGPKAQIVNGPSSNLRGTVTIDICVDMLTAPDTVACDAEESVVADSNGFFSTIVNLPVPTGQSQVNYKITAKAHDDYGNQTPPSQAISVVLDTLAPFNYVNLTPTLTGVTTAADYQNFLNGNIDISQLRTITMTANVTQNTEQVEMSFADFTNLPVRPNTPTYNFIASVNNQQESNTQYNPLNNPNIKHNYNLPLGNPGIPTNNCASGTGCDWQYVFPVTEGFGGKYEVLFRAKKGTTVQEATRGFKADGTIPAAPLIMIVEKWDATLNDWVKLDMVNQKYFTNDTKIRLRGAAEPKTNLQLFSHGQLLTNQTVADTGIWEFQVDFATYLSGINSVITCNQFSGPTCVGGDLDFNLVEQELDSSNNVINQVPGSNHAPVTYDAVAPQLTSIIRTTPANTIPGWLRTGDQSTYTVVGNEGLRYVDLIKEDDYTLLFNNIANQTNWQGTVNVDRTAEGYYNPKIRIVDLAGNKTVYDATQWNTYGLGDFRVYIDDTLPDTTVIDKTGWGVDNGVKADGILPELGRTNPEYVLKGDHVTIHGTAEANQRIELHVNNQFHHYINVSANNCQSQGADITASDGLVVKYMIICDWTYDYYFPADGKAADSGGAASESYIFQVRVVDPALNVSAFTKQEIVYHDTLQPVKPAVLSANSASYAPIVDWQTNGVGSAITKDTSVTLGSLAERFADMEYTMTSPANLVTKPPLFVNNADRKANTTFNLGASTRDGDRAECVKDVNGRLTGTCSDGTYTFTLKSTDAAGNVSETLTGVKLERDTVTPTKPSLSISANDDAQTISLQIHGEPAAYTVINGNRNYKMPGGGTLMIQVVSSYSWLYDTVYTFKVEIEDRAGNRSETAVASYRTPPPPVRVAGVCSSANSGGKLSYPYAGSYVVTSPFGWRELRGEKSYHDGMDFGVPSDTEILAAAKGDVVYISTDRSEGLGYIIHHPELGVSTIYWHFDKNIAGYRGVQPGQVIGLSDNTGNSTGAHLHFGVRTGGSGTEVNPDPWLGSCDGKSGGSDNNNSNSGDNYNGIDASKFAKPSITFDRWISADGSSKDSKVKESKAPDAPVITLTKTADDGKSVTLYGVAMPKNAPIDVVVWNEYRYCGYCGSSWEYKYQEGKASNVQVAFYKEDGTYLGQLWNDRTDGKWEITLQLGDKLKAGDKIKAQLQIFTDFTFNDLHWWKDTFETYKFDVRDSKYFGTPYFPSGYSNTVPILGTYIADPIERAIREKEVELGNADRNGDIHQWCGYSVQDYNHIGSHTDSIIMYNPTAKRAYLITGVLWWSYRSNGGCEFFGAPQMDEQRTGRVDGWVQKFEKATIYWADNDGKSQPGIVQGSVRDYYESMGGTWGYLGFPEGKQWSETSFCNVTGQMQHFHDGRIYSSPLGNADVHYDEWFRAQNEHGIGGPNGTGWPLGNPYKVNATTADWQFERGIIHWYTFSMTFESYAGCSGGVQRNNDNNYGNKDQVKTIQDTENTLFRSYERENGGNGNGSVHNWCDTAVVDYDKAVLKDGTKIEDAIMMVNGTHAYLVANFEGGPYTWNTYRWPDDHGQEGCKRLGLPTNNNEKIPGQWGMIGSSYQRGAWRQTFQKGDLYWYWQPVFPGVKDTGMGIYVLGKIRDRYNKEGNPGSNHNYGLPKEYAKVFQTGCNNNDYKGDYQAFYAGDVFSSGFGTYGFKYEWQAAMLLRNQLLSRYMYGLYDSLNQDFGWPVSELQVAPEGYRFIDFQKGRIKEDWFLGAKYINDSTKWGCSDFERERQLRDSGQNIPDDVKNAIYAKETQVYVELHRADGDIGQIRPYSCGTNTWAVQYYKSKKFGGAEDPHGMIIYSNGQAYYLSGDILNNYLNNDGCKQLGLPIGDYEQIRSNANKYGFQQKFEKGMAVQETGKSVYFVTDAIGIKYRGLGGADGPVGFPEDNPHYNSTTKCSKLPAQKWSFEQARIYQISTQNPNIIYKGTGFEQKYWSAGEVGSNYGWPTSEEYTNANNQKRLNLEAATMELDYGFLGIPYINVQEWGCGNNADQRSNDSLAIPETNAIWQLEDSLFTKYTRLDKQSIHQYCNNQMYAVEYSSAEYRFDSDYQDMDRNITRGMIVAKGNKAYLIQGEILDYYKQGTNCSRIGFPQNNTTGAKHDNRKGKYQQFANMDIVNSDLGTYEMIGGIRQKYRDVKYASSDVGFPSAGRSDELTSSCGTKGYKQQFEKGMIYSSGQGAFQLAQNSLLDKYKELGEEKRLGWPTGEQHPYMLFWGAIDFERGIVNTMNWQTTFADFNSCKTGGVELGNGEPLPIQLVDFDVYDPTSGGLYKPGDEFYDIQNEGIAAIQVSTDDAANFQTAITAGLSTIFSSDLGGQVGYIAQFVLGLGEGIVDGAWQVVKGIGDIASLLLNHLDQIPGLINNLSRLIQSEGFFQFISQTINQGNSEALKDFFKMSPDEQIRFSGKLIGEALFNIIVLVIPGANALIDTVQAVAKGSSEAIAALMRNISTFFSDWAEDGFGSAVNKAVSKTIQLGGVVLNGIKVGVTDGMAKIGDIAESLKTLPRDSAEAVISGLELISGNTRATRWLNYQLYSRLGLIKDAGEGFLAVVNAEDAVKVFQWIKQTGGVFDVAEYSKFAEEIKQPMESFFIFKRQQQLVQAWKNIISSENSLRKGNFGEITSDANLTDQGYGPLHQRIIDIDRPTEQGLDGVFIKDGKYYLLEEKYGSATLGQTTSGLQMSDQWLLSNNAERLVNAVGEDQARLILSNGYTKVLAHISSDGTVTYKTLDSAGKVIGAFIP